MKEYITLALTVIGGLGGWAMLKYLFNWSTERRKAESEAKKGEIEVMRSVLNTLDEKVKQLSEKVDELYKQVHQLENEKLQLIIKNNELSLALKEAQNNVCLRPDDECLKRMPPRDYCRLRKLARGEYDKFYKDIDNEQKEKGNDENNGVFEIPDKGRDA